MLSADFLPNEEEWRGLTPEQFYALFCSPEELGKDFNYFPARLIANALKITPRDLLYYFNAISNDERIFTSDDNKFKQEYNSKKSHYINEKEFPYFDLALFETNNVFVYYSDWDDWKKRHCKPFQEGQKVFELLNIHPLQEIDDKMKKLEEENTALQKELNEILTQHGLCSLVIQRRREGKTNHEIARELKTKNNLDWCSLSQIGALLTRDLDLQSDTMKKYGTGWYHGNREN